jgi:hypothetical protein
MDWRKTVRCLPLALGVCFAVVAAIYLIVHLLLLYL